MDVAYIEGIVNNGNFEEPLLNYRVSIYSENLSSKIKGFISKRLGAFSKNNPLTENEKKTLASNLERISQSYERNKQTRPDLFFHMHKIPEEIRVLETLL